MRREERFRTGICETEPPGSTLGYADSGVGTKIGTTENRSIFRSDFSPWGDEGRRLVNFLSGLLSKPQ
jgi:hypothetical protein